MYRVHKEMLMDKSEAIKLGGWPILPVSDAAQVSVQKAHANLGHPALPQLLVAEDLFQQSCCLCRRVLADFLFFLP